MGSEDSQEYIFTLTEFLYKRITNQPFLELLRRSVLDQTVARWFYFARSANSVPDYGQIFRFFMKGTSAAAILASPNGKMPFFWKRQVANPNGTRKNAYSTTISDIDMVLVVNPLINQYDYTIVRSLLILCMIEGINEWIQGPRVEYKGEMYDDGAVNEHILAAPVGGELFLDESMVLQKILFNSETSPRPVPANCPFKYKFMNNIIVGGEQTGSSLIKVLGRSARKTELLDILIPSHHNSAPFGNWIHSDWLVNYEMTAPSGAKLTLPIMHPQYLVLEFQFARSMNLREEKTEKRLDAEKLMIDLLNEDDLAEELNAE